MTLKRHSTWGDLFALAGLFLGATLIAALPMATISVVAPDMERGAMMLATYTIQFTVAIAGGVMWLRARGGARLRFGVRWSGAPAILAGIVLTAAASIALEPVLNLFPASYLERLGEAIGRGGWAIATTVVAAPLLEEIFFRGIVLEHLSRRWSPAAAGVASSALFALAHVPILPQMVNAFVVAVVMGYIYLSARSLLPVIVIHAANNGVAYLLLELTGTQSTDTRTMLGSDTIYWVVYGASLVVVLLSLAAMSRRVRTKNGKNTLQSKTADE
ncbi:MAG: CPBP family intramembrane metalloprotease [Alistipes sp.]|jgi:membrane protease YdiL (CAAX protease family)|nr:CPBP family intramembrane metalloprotease [Alistipes sp.]